MTTHRASEKVQRTMYSSAELTISIIVPVYNGGANFRRCLVSLLEALPPPTEIIVVADGDTDGSGELAKEFGAQVLRFPSLGGPRSQKRSPLLCRCRCDNSARCGGSGGDGVQARPISRGSLWVI